jgi:hypothetical protein
MKHLPAIFVLCFLGLIGYRYYQPQPQKKTFVFKPEKLKISPPKPKVDSSYDTAYARYLRQKQFKYVLKNKDWPKRTAAAIAEQDRLILFYHEQIKQRRRLLIRQEKELAKLQTP